MNVKQKLIFAAEVLVVIAAVYAIQKKAGIKVPLVGEFLPGGQ